MTRTVGLWHIPRIKSSSGMGTKGWSPRNVKIFQIHFSKTQGKFYTTKHFGLFFSEENSPHFYTKAWIENGDRKFKPWRKRNPSFPQKEQEHIKYMFILKNHSLCLRFLVLSFSQWLCYSFLPACYRQNWVYNTGSLDATNKLVGAPGFMRRDRTSWQYNRTVKSQGKQDYFMLFLFQPGQS